MKPKFLLGLLAAGVLGAAGYGLYATGMQRGMGMTKPLATSANSGPSSDASATQAVPQGIAEGEEATRRHIAAGIKAGDVDPATGKKVLYYHDPMVPGNKFDRPAKSPFMDMMLVPVYADDNAGADGAQGGVAISARTQQNLGVRTAAVVEGNVAPQLTAVGSIAFNERDQAVIQARAAGFVERVHVRATQDAVAKGQALVDLFLPDWLAAQQELLSLQRMQGKDMAALVDGARQRMRLLGMTDAQIQLVESSGKPQARTTIAAPLAGVVTELSVREGMTVAVGAPLFRISGLSTVWANAELPESQAAWVRPGAKVEAHSPATPGVTFTGTVQALLPEVNPATRTLKARVELRNVPARLVPGMSATMQFADTHAQKALLIPSEAVIMTGKRNVVLLSEEGGNAGHFRPVEVELGIESGGQTEIKRGLAVGQRVVVSSQFMIDSEASLKGVEARLNDAMAPARVMPQQQPPMGHQP